MSEAMIPLRFGNIRVELHRGYTKTIFEDGSELVARHDQTTQDQEDLARQLGYDNAEQMNSEHDVAHSLVCYWLGMPYSGSLYAAAHKIKPTEVNWYEEGLVLTLQGFCRKNGIDLIFLARKATAESEGYL